MFTGARHSPKLFTMEENPVREFSQEESIETNDMDFEFVDMVNASREFPMVEVHRVL